MQRTARAALTITPDQFSSVADQMPSATKTTAAKSHTHAGTRSMAGECTRSALRTLPEFVGAGSRLVRLLAGCIFLGRAEMLVGAMWVSYPTQILTPWEVGHARGARGQRTSPSVGPQR